MNYVLVIKNFTYLNTHILKFPDAYPILCANVGTVYRTKIPAEHLNRDVVKILSNSELLYRTKGKINNVKELT